MKNSTLLIIFSAAYILLFLLFFPKFMFILDDSGYLRAAYMFSKGATCIEDPLHVYKSFSYNGQCYASDNFPGYSIFLVPFLLLGWKLVFSSGMLLHLAGTFIFYLLLRRLGHKGYYALLYLMFPPFIYFSTVLINNYLVAVLLLAAFYFYIGTKPRDYAISGALFGAAVLTRYTLLVAFLSFAAVTFFTNRKRFWLMALGFAPFAALIALYNYIAFGGVLSTGYSSGSAILRTDTTPLTASWLLVSIPSQMLSYLMRLLLLYPLLLLGIFFYKGEGRWELITGASSVFVVYSTFAAIAGDPTISTISTSNIVFGGRYLLPIMALMLVAYVPMLERVSELVRIKPKHYVIAASVALLLIAALLLQAQAAVTGRNLAVSNAIYANTGENALIVGSEISYLFLLEQIGDRRYIPLADENFTRLVDNNTFIVYALPDSDDAISPEVDPALSKVNATLKYRAIFEARPWITPARPKIRLHIYKAGE